MTKKKETFLTKEQVEKEGRVNLSVKEQPTIKLRMLKGHYAGIVQDTPKLKGLEMIKNGKAEMAGPGVKVMPPETHEMRARTFRAEKQEKENKEAQARKTK